MAFDDLERIGVNRAADATNHLAVSADATLLTHDGASHQPRLNKAAAGDTAWLLFQTGRSGPADEASPMIYAWASPSGRSCSA